MTSRFELGLTGMLSLLSSVFMFTLQLEGLVRIFQSLAKQIFIVGIWVGILLIVAGLVVRVVPELAPSSPRMIRGGAYLLVGLAVLNLVFSAFGIPLMNIDFHGTLISSLSQNVIGIQPSMQFLDVILVTAIFLGVFMISFLPGFAVGYFGEIPLFHKYHLIAIGIFLILSMALLGILLGWIVWLILLPYYALGACLGYMAKTGTLYT